MRIHLPTGNGASITAMQPSAKGPRFKVQFDEGGQVEVLVDTRHAAQPPGELTASFMVRDLALVLPRQDHAPGARRRFTLMPPVTAH